MISIFDIELKNYDVLSCDNKNGFAYIKRYDNPNYALGGYLDGFLNITQDSTPCINFQIMKVPVKEYELISIIYSDLNGALFDSLDRDLNVKPHYFSWFYNQLADGIIHTSDEFYNTMIKTFGVNTFFMAVENYNWQIIKPVDDFEKPRFLWYNPNIDNDLG